MTTTRPPQFVLGPGCRLATEGRDVTARRAGRAATHPVPRRPQQVPRRPQQVPRG